MAIVGLDIDGCLSNFTDSYAAILTKLTGIEFPKAERGSWPTEWYWDRTYGVTKEQEGAAWAEIKSSKSFWYDLGLAEGAPEFLDKLGESEHEVYFITDRPGYMTQSQTWGWLSEMFPDPAVVISRKGKGIVCKALSIEVYLDDKPENVEDVWAVSPQTRTYLLKWPYNARLQESMGANAVDSLEEFAERAGLWT